MTDGIKKKNLRARKGKQRWRKNIDVTEFLENVHQRTREEEMEQRIRETKKKALLTIDTKPDANIKKELDPNRFKRKENLDIERLRKNELKIVKKLMQTKLKNGQLIEEETQNIQEDVEEQEVFDLWEGEKAREYRAGRPSKVEIHLEDVRAAPVIVPHAGQSYNPSMKAHKELVSNVIEEEVQKVKVNKITHKKPKELLVKRRRPRTEAEERHEERMERKRKEKEVERDINNAQAILNSIEKKKRAIQRKMEMKGRQVDEIKEKLKEGVVVKAPKFGKKRYRMKDTDFTLVDDLKPNLRAVEPVGSLLRERFDTVYRRGLIEFNDPLSKPKNNRKKIPKFKYHNVVRERDTKKGEDRMLGVFQELKLLR